MQWRSCTRDLANAIRRSSGSIAPMLSRDVHLVFLADPKWDPFREDPRFRALVKRRDFMRTEK